MKLCSNPDCVAADKESFPVARLADYQTVDGVVICAFCVLTFTCQEMESSVPRH